MGERIPIRMNAKAVSATSERGHSRVDMSWWTRRRVAVSSLATAVLGWGLAHTQTSAFAAAAEALLPECGVLHFTETLVMTDTQVCSTRRVPPVVYSLPTGRCWLQP